MLKEQINAILALGIRRAMLANKIGISRPTFDKWYQGESISDESLNKIQEYVDWFKKYTSAI